MIVTSEKESILRKFEDEADKNISAMGEFDIAGLCKVGDSNSIVAIVDEIRDAILAAIPEGYAVPKTLIYTACSSFKDDGGINLISVSINPSSRETKKFRFVQQFIVMANVLDDIETYIYESFRELLLDNIIDKNIAEVNELLAGMCEKAGVGYTISLVSPLNQGNKKLSYISDDEIVFVADRDRIFAVQDIMVFQSESSLVSAEDIEKAKIPLVDEISANQTAVQLVASHGGSLVKYLCDVSSLVKPMTFIRKVASKNVEKLLGSKDTLAYYEKNGVFAIVERSNGDISLVLKPFDVQTLEPSDVDVLKEILEIA